MLEPVTNQVTTVAGNGRHSPTYPDTGIPLNCGNQAQCDGVRPNRQAFLGEGLRFGSVIGLQFSCVCSMESDNL